MPLKQSNCLRVQKEVQKYTNAWNCKRHLVAGFTEMPVGVKNSTWQCEVQRDNGNFVVQLPATTNHWATKTLNTRFVRVCEKAARQECNVWANRRNVAKKRKKKIKQRNFLRKSSKKKKKQKRVKEVNLKGIQCKKVGELRSIRRK